MYVSWLITDCLINTLNKKIGTQRTGFAKYYISTLSKWEKSNIWYLQSVRGKVTDVHVNFKIQLCVTIQSKNILWQ